MLWRDELYLLEDQIFFSCYNAGTLHFKHCLPGSGHKFSASPVGASERIYLLSECGTTFVLQRGSAVKVLAVNKLEGETFHASPAIVDDGIYLRGDKHLFCFAK